MGGYIVISEISFWPFEFYLLKRLLRSVDLKVFKEGVVIVVAD